MAHLKPQQWIDCGTPTLPILNMYIYMQAATTVDCDETDKIRKEGKKYGENRQKRKGEGGKPYIGLILKWRAMSEKIML